MVLNKIITYFLLSHANFPYFSPHIIFGSFFLLGGYNFIILIVTNKKTHRINAKGFAFN